MAEFSRWRHFSRWRRHTQSRRNQCRSLYTLDELNDRLGLGKKALRTARREGLIVKRIGRRGYVLGRDVIEWFESSAKPTT